MTPTPSAPNESPLLALSETPGFALDTGDHRMVMVLAASVFGKFMPTFGGIDFEDNAKNGSIAFQNPGNSVVIGDYVAQAGSTNTINIYLNTTDGNTGGTGPVLNGLGVGVGLGFPPLRSNCREKWIHLQSVTETQWRFWRRAYEDDVIEPAAGDRYDFNPSNTVQDIITFSDEDPLTYSGFAVFPHTIENASPSALHGNPPGREAVGACIYLYAAGTKGIISRHKRDGALLKAAAPNKVTVVDLPDNGLVGYDCEADEAIIFWIGLQSPFDIPIWAIPPPPDFDPATKGLMLIR